MKRHLFVFIIAILGIGLFLFSGCGEDKSPAVPAEQIVPADTATGKIEILDIDVMEVTVITEFYGSMFTEVSEQAHEDNRHLKVACEVFTYDNELEQTYKYTSICSCEAHPNIGIIQG